MAKGSKRVDDGIVFLIVVGEVVGREGGQDASLGIQFAKLLTGARCRKSGTDESAISRSGSIDADARLAGICVLKDVHGPGLRSLAEAGEVGGTNGTL